VGFAVGVENAGGWVVAHAAGAVLVTYAFERDALFEVGVEGDVGGGVAGSFEDVYPAVFEAVEGFDVVGGVGELNAVGCVDGDRVGLVGAAGVAGGVSPDCAGLEAFGGGGCGVVEGDAVVGVGEVFGGEPPGDGAVLHGFEDEAGCEGWGVAFHHLEVEAADGLDLTERVGVGGVGVFEVEVVGAPGFGVGVVVGFGGDSEESVGLVVHEVAADLVGRVGEAVAVLGFSVFGGRG